MHQPDVYVLLPTIYRPSQLRRVLESIRDTAPDIGIVVAIEQNDEASALVAHEFGAILTRCPDHQGGVSYAWNIALRAAPATAQAFVLGADDLIFKPGWYEATISALDSIGGDGLVGFNDLHKSADFSTHFLMTRNHLVKVNGGVMACPHYRAEGVDYEACRRAQKAGKYIKANAAQVEHDWNGRHPDQWFKLNMQSWGKTRRLMKEREKLGWPNDFKAVIV